MAKKSKKLTEDKKYTLIGVGFCLIVAIIVVIVIALNDSGKKEEETMSVYEAQTKCTLMREATLVNVSGEPFGEATTEKADKACRKLWDRTIDVNNTDEKFIEEIKSQWENRKTEVLEGYTLEEYYNESVK